MIESLDLNVMVKRSQLVNAMLKLRVGLDIVLAIGAPHLVLTYHSVII